MRCLLLLPAYFFTFALCACPREPHHSVSSALKSPGDHGFQVRINGDPDRYVPGSNYVLSIIGGRNKSGSLEKFKAFLVTVEASFSQNEDPDLSSGSDGPLRVGGFMLYSDEHTQYHHECINTVKESDMTEKSEIQIMWGAPQKGSGCVTFRAMVLTDKDTWYADDGALSKKLCEVTPEYLRGEEDSSGNSLECCACDEAKYSMIFEGIWSNITHPKNFPTNLWLTHFSDVIGASHRRNFSFWGEGQFASDGLRQVAEWGSVRVLETELKAKARNLRTLIKAAGLWHPRVNENTTSTFRVDRNRNLLSIVSMLGPTPDWIVGVSGLNLCRRDCTWIDSKDVDLYPYDAGTDSGIAYMSPNEPTVPQERIHRITPLYPEDPRSPFYDPLGRPMQPLAKLYLKLESVTSKSCDEVEDGTVELPAAFELTENTEDTRRPECNVTEYSGWTECSVTCGKGIRMRSRSYLMPQKAGMLGCNRQLVSKEMCVASQPSCQGGPLQLPADSEEAIEDNEAVCETSPYGEWSECSTTCGVGVSMRTRRFLDRSGRKKCPHINLVEKKECIEPPCPPPSPGINMDERCTVSEWSDWSPCSATCGTGLKYRSRLLLVSGEMKDVCAGRVELQQQRICTLQADCRVDRASAKQICMMEPEVGPCRGFFERWYFDPREKKCVTFPYGGCRGNRNNFRQQAECNDACGVIRDELQFVNSASSTVNSPQADSRVDCIMGEWSDWTPCSVSCGLGKSVRVRMIKVTPQNGGTPCPRRLLKKKTCQGPPC